MERVYEKYDDYDAYEVSKSEYIDDFVSTHLDYLLEGGQFGAPITFLDKYENGAFFEIVDCDYMRPKLHGKELCYRYIWKLTDDAIEDIKVMKESGCIITAQPNGIQAPDGNRRPARKNGGYRQVTKINADKDYTVTWKDAESKNSYYTHLHCKMIVPALDARPGEITSEQADRMRYNSLVCGQLMNLLQDIENGREKIPGGWLKDIKEKYDPDTFKYINVAEYKEK